MSTNRFALRFIIASASLIASPALAQVDFYVGVEGGVERRQSLSDGAGVGTDVNGVNQMGSEEGFAYGVFAGAEAPVSSSMFAGVEANVGRSEVETDAIVFRGIELVESILVGAVDRTRVHPPWSYAVTGRLGFDLSRSVSVYGLAGLGGERVRVELRTDLNEFGASAVRTRRSYDGVTFGGGARLFLSDRVGARMEYRRTETDDGYDPERLVAGLFYRF